MSEIDEAARGLRKAFNVGDHWTPAMLLGYAALTNGAAGLAKRLAEALCQAGREAEVAEGVEWADKRRSFWSWATGHKNKVEGTRQDFAGKAAGTVRAVVEAKRGAP